MLNFNHKITLEGGQAFNWKAESFGFVGIMIGYVVVVIPDLNKIEVFGKDTEFNASRYFNKTEDLKRIEQIHKEDFHISTALKSFTELRILNQDFEQTLLSFILSAHKNIKAIRKLVWDISNKYGNVVKTPYGSFNTFPNVEVLSKIPVQELRSLGCGFRSENFSNAAKRLVLEKNIYTKFRTREEWESYLISFRGIGKKIRDCILVFGLGYKDITPLDIWGKRVLVDLYGIDPNLKYNEMRNVYTEKFGPNTSIIGQYLFEYIRLNLGKKYVKHS